jgi:hypothetical protein
MRRRQPATHRLVPAADVQRLTGFSAEEVLLQRDTEQLVQIDETGTRHEFFRIPVGLLLEQPEDGDGSDD